MPRRPEPRWHKARQRWFARIGEPGPDGKARQVYAPASVGKADKKAAWDWFEAEVARRDTPTVPGDVWTVEKLCEHYLKWCEARAAEGKLSPVHYRSKTYHLGYWADAHGPRRVETLDRPDMAAFVEGLAAKYAPNYASNICSSVAAALNWGVRHRHLPKNPVAGFDTPVIPRAPERFAERSEAAAFLALWRRRAAAAGPVRGRYERLTVLLERCLIRTGARPGELCALHWADLRWNGGKTPEGHAFAKAVIPPERWKSGQKTGKPRTLYFSPALTRALRREHEREGRHPTHVFVHGGGRGGVGWGEPWADGSRLSKAVLHARRKGREVIASLRARAEAGEALPAVDRWLARAELHDEGAQRVVNYRWRHTAASTLLMMGLDIATVAELLGTSPQMISSIYGHLLDTHLADAAHKLAHGRLRKG